MRLSKSFIFICLAIIGVVFADEDAAAPAADVDGRAKLLVSKQVIFQLCFVAYITASVVSLDDFNMTYELLRPLGM